ncbi:MAG TPA: cupin domain-containing protein [Candidatus Udaeobacter sp.]|nr:cupin domain-containing protein [Candidatus Udaeobacter sp.]
MAQGERINLGQKLASFAEHWHPKLVDTVDDYEIKVVKLLGDFVWHRHAGEDELFLVLKGAFRMDFRDRQVSLSAGEMIVVPRGVEHKPFAEQECEILLLERRGVVNTGDATAGALTRGPVERI